jgi:hypothetical protein
MIRFAGTLLTGALLASGAVACATSTGQDDVRFRILEARQTAPADAWTLLVRGQLTNNSTEPLVSGGCLRPNIAVDSLAGDRWVDLNTRQSEELVVCIRAFTVDPGSTAEFDATFSRTNFSEFPAGVPLRLRVMPANDVPGPTVTFQLPR